MHTYFLISQIFGSITMATVNKVLSSLIIIIKLNK